MNYLINILVSISQALNTILGGNPDMTFSARAYVNRHNKNWNRVYKLVNKIYFWQTNHCATSFAADVEYAKYVKSLKSK